MSRVTFWQKELREAVRDWRLVGMAGLMLALSFVALALGAANVTDHERERRSIEAQDRAAFLAQGARNPHASAHFSMWAFRPLGAPALLDPGVTPFAGEAVWMEAHTQSPARGRAAETMSEAPLGQFSAASVLQVIGPLLMILIGAATIARERERGAWRLLLAAGRAPSAIAWSKLRSSIGIAALALSPIVIAVVGALLLAPAGLSADSIARVTTWIAIHAVFLTTVLLIASAVSALSRTTSQALVVLAAFWALSVAVVPKLGVAAAAAVAPPISAEAFWRDVRADLDQGIDGHNNEDARAETLQRNTLARYGVSRVEDLPVSWEGVQLQASEEYSNQVFDRRYGVLKERAEAQQAVMRWFGLASPLVPVQHSSMAMAGTDRAHHDDFAGQAEAHRRRIVAYLNGDMIAHGAGKAFDYVADAKLLTDVAPFSYVPKPFDAALRSAWPDLAAALAWLAGAFALFAFATRRLDIEAM